MTQNASVRWLATYDISDPRNLVRVFKLLKKEGVPIQYSVFLINTNAVKISVLLGRISKMINPKTDDVRIYRIPEKAWITCIGASIIPEYLWLDDTNDQL